MSVDTLQAVVGAAIVDRRFCDLLLRNPAEAVKDFDLSSEERTMVIGIQASDIQQFAAQLHDWLCHRPQPATEAIVRPRYRYTDLLAQAV